ncbi:MAG: cupin domain-containing protein, partial [Bryobacteraceae bacterium]
SIVRGGRGKWMQTPWKGVAYMRLRYDGATGFTTGLLRIDPGARYPAHHHNGVEQSWVLQGSCRIGSVTIRAGDFACAEAGTDHGVLESDEGCVLLIMSSEKDEVFA